MIISCAIIRLSSQASVTSRKSLSDRSLCQNKLNNFQAFHQNDYLFHNYSQKAQSFSEHKTHKNKATMKSLKVLLKTRYGTNKIMTPSVTVGC